MIILTHIDDFSLHSMWNIGQWFFCISVCPMCALVPAGCSVPCLKYWQCLLWAQEWSNGQFKTAVGEVLFEMTDEPGPFISMELVYFPEDLHVSEVGQQARCIDRPKIVSFRDQILVALVLLCLFYLFWRWVVSASGTPEYPCQCPR